MTLDEAMRLAMRHHHAGRLAEAEQIYRQIIQQDPRCSEAIHNLGLIAHRRGSLSEAEELLRRAIELQPGAGQYFASLAVVYGDMGRTELSIQFARKSIELQPDCADGWRVLGARSLEGDKTQEALEYFRRALATRPDSADGHNDLGNTLRKLERWQEAIEAYRRAIELRPDFAAAWHNLGAACSRAQDFSNAEECFRKAVELDPNFADGHSGLGTVLVELHRFDEAAARLDQALQLEPDLAAAHWNLAPLLLRLGDFKRGWAEYEWRSQVKSLNIAPRPYTQPRWTGGRLEGKTILLYGEQGFGDYIQFARYVPLVAQRGGRVVLECLPPLKELFESIPSVGQVVCGDDPSPEFDVHCPLLSLPLVMGTDRLEAIPANVPYLKAPAASVDRFARKLASQESGMQIGLAWAGSPAHADDWRRSMKLRDLAPLSRASGAIFISLQKGPAAQGRDPPAGMRWLDLTDQLNDFAQTAALIESLDLVIAVDTAVAHLAGALGKPVWLLLPFSADWRWLLNRDDSPWYPTMRLFRQPRPGDWTAVIQAVAERLRTGGV